MSRSNRTSHGGGTLINPFLFYFLISFPDVLQGSTLSIITMFSIISRRSYSVQTFYRFRTIRSYSMMDCFLFS